MKSMASLLWIVVWMALPWLQCTGGAMLFRVSPGGDGVRPPGLWGGEVTGAGREADLFSAGYGGLSNHGNQDGNQGGNYGNGLRVETAAYDSVSQSVLLLVDDSGQTDESLVTSGTSGGSGSVLTAAYGPVCGEGEGTLETLFLRTRLVDPDNPYLTDPECGIQCGWGPFAAHDTKVYFVLSAVFGRSPASLERRIQLRVLEGCEDDLQRAENGEEAHDFDVVGCSRLLSTLHTEPYTKPNPRPLVWTAPTLSVYDINSDLQFFIQLFDVTGSTEKLKLMRYSTKADSSKILHQSSVQARYASNLRIRGSGSVDYLEGVLCWTATDRLLCSLYPGDGTGETGGGELRAARVLDPGDAVRAGICTGSLPLPELVNSITGVAIAGTGDSLSVYFGCYSNIAGVGGVGLAQVTRHGLSYTLTRLSSGPTAVYGGTLFLTHGLSHYCPAIATSSMPSYSTSSVTSSSDGDVTVDVVSTSRTTLKRPGIFPTSNPSTGGARKSCYSLCLEHLVYIHLLVACIIFWR